MFDRSYFRFVEDKLLELDYFHRNSVTMSGYQQLADGPSRPAADIDEKEVTEAVQTLIRINGNLV